MTPPTSFEFQVTWADLDSNRHLRNTGYLDYAAQARFLYFDSRGHGREEFEIQGIGPAILTETITYRKELHFLERFRAELYAGGADEKNVKFISTVRFVGADGKLRAQISSLFVWFDLKQRKAVPAPPLLLKGMQEMPHAEDYKVIN